MDFAEFMKLQLIKQYLLFLSLTALVDYELHEMFYTSPYIANLLNFWDYRNSYTIGCFGSKFQ